MSGAHRAKDKAGLPQTLVTLKSNAINHLNPAHKSGDARVRIASSVQSLLDGPLMRWARTS